MLYFVSSVVKSPDSHNWIQLEKKLIGNTFTLKDKELFSELRKVKQTKKDKLKRITGLNCTHTSTQTHTHTHGYYL